MYFFKTFFILQQKCNQLTIVCSSVFKVIYTKWLKHYFLFCTFGIFELFSWCLFLLCIFFSFCLFFSVLFPHTFFLCTLLFSLVLALVPLFPSRFSALSTYFSREYYLVIFWLPSSLMVSGCLFFFPPLQSVSFI